MLIMNRPTLTNRQYVLPFILVTSLFFLWGFARAILDVLNKHFQNALDITMTQSALIQVTTYLGYFIMAIPAGWFINRHGYRTGVIFGLTLFGVGALLFIPGAEAGTFYAYLGALFIIGCGLVFLETSANPYVTELGAPETATSRLNFSQSFNGLGCLSATFIVGQFFFSGPKSEAGGKIVVPYAILGILVLLIAVVFSRVNLPEINHHETDEDRAKGTRISKLFHHHTMFVFGLFAQLFHQLRYREGLDVGQCRLGHPDAGTGFLHVGPFRWQLDHAAGKGRAHAHGLRHGQSDLHWTGALQLG